MTTFQGCCGHADYCASRFALQAEITTVGAFSQNADAELYLPSQRYGLSHFAKRAANHTVRSHETLTTLMRRGEP
jgi:hypothetical protein